MAVLSGELSGGESLKAHEASADERRSRKKNKNLVAPAPISSQFHYLCPPSLTFDFFARPTKTAMLRRLKNLI